MRILALILALQVLIASTGVSVFRHVCNMTSGAYIGLMEKACGDTKTDNVSCCGEKVSCSIDKAEGSDCCQTTSTYFKADLTGIFSDVRLESQKHMPAVSSFILAAIPVIHASQHALLSLENKAPALLNISNASRQALLQTFRC